MDIWSVHVSGTKVLTKYAVLLWLIPG